MANPPKIPCGVSIHKTPSSGMFLRISYSPSKGPHCPTVASTVYPPARRDSVEWILLTHANNSATEAKISTLRKILKYRGAVVVVVALIMNPMAASVAARAQKGPRILNLSESQVRVMIVRKQRM